MQPGPAPRDDAGSSCFSAATLASHESAAMTLIGLTDACRDEVSAVKALSVRGVHLQVVDDTFVHQLGLGSRHPGRSIAPCDLAAGSRCRNAANTDPQDADAVDGTTGTRSCTC